MDDVQEEVMRTQSPKSYLYSTIAQTHLGEISSIIITTLISNGRLTIRELNVRTKLSIKTIKKALVSLIQLNCIFYWQELNNIFYSFNEIGILKFLHSGDILNHITKKFGEEEAEIIQNVLTFGHIKINDYLSEYDEKTKIKKQELFMKLFSDKWIVKLNQFNFNPINDIWNKIFHDILKNTPRSSSQSEIKRVAEAKEKTREQLKLLLEKSQANIYITQNGIKKLDPNLIVTFNLSRFQKHLRTNAFVNLAKSRIGILTAEIYKVALETIENNSPDLTDAEMEINGLLSGPTDVEDHLLNMEGNLLRDNKIVFNARDISLKLTKKIVLTGSIQTGGRSSQFEHDEQQPSKKIKLENGESSNIVIEHSQETVQNHLNLLASGVTSFITQVSPGRYTVPFYNLTKKLKLFNFEYLIKATLKEHSFRVFRCVLEQKLTDEKSISNAVLLKEKQVRTEVYHLIKNGFIEIQEIPRSADRAASKTFYSFRSKLKFDYEFLLNCLIYDLGECLNIIQNFKFENKILLEKCNRIDVKGKENELLMESELKTLHSLQNREIKFMVKFNRIKSLYDIFSL
ncbi:unnamed protein product [Candida verbasci]|uniref:DNA-directed RNA polymerase III subunit RPC3 n=1 Tax=Candida verbasci TaxID=1227364 RepID=A0A9W4TRR6_9ASCO|nr:unnamed protein product [Candida verbasci]